ncbi:PP2C family protein-serine/threonine phosphatase [Streptomyces sp. NPDC047453]|uniref:PP2C family protein-serine/threonine phosphatase n=1 Tax=Streptomyces sp. NPDC047453 TaxID=3154812 RepID=UPI0033D459EF
MVHIGKVNLGQRLAHPRQLWQSSHALVAIPLVLIVAIILADLRSPESVHLGPLLVVAPAITASFGGYRLTGLIGALAVGAQVLLAVLQGGVDTTNHISQIIALTILSVFAVIVCLVRDRRTAELAQVRSVSEAAQRALLRPLPDRLGPLHIASSYLAAEKEACIGGDLYAVARTGDRTRVIVGDVRGKGLAAIGEAATLLGSFQEAAHHHPTLPALAEALDRSVCRYLTGFPQSDEEAQEHFITALLLEIPDHSPVSQVVHCGHPPPFLIRHDQVTPVTSPCPAPPLGMSGLGPETYDTHTFSFHAGDTLLLYTDGVVEARDSSKAFYPLQERVAEWTQNSPRTLVQCVEKDLLAHADGALSDDAAILAIQRTPVPHTRLHATPLVHSADLDDPTG